MTSTEERVERQRRLSRNQALFREVNERVNDLSDEAARPVLMGSWVCECANETCSERIALTDAEYQALRAVATHFAVVPADSHVYLDVERVIQRNERYWVVEKVERGGEVAEEFDPRGDRSASAE